MRSAGSGAGMSADPQRRLAAAGLKYTAAKAIRPHSDLHPFHLDKNLESVFKDAL